MQTSTPMIAFIGAGNMGHSLIGGLIKDGHPPDKIIATDKDENKLAELAKLFSIQTTTNNIQAVATADVIVLAVKPQIMPELINGIANHLPNKHPLIISIAAGIRTKDLEKWLAKSYAIVRAMPNTPALVGTGATGLFANTHASIEDKANAESILRAVGLVAWVDNEAMLDAVTALSGSGPAYFFLVMEAMQEAGVVLGLTEETARILTLQTALGAARMAMASDKTPAQLREQVTSKGGTTEKAVSVLEENNLRNIFKKALQSAKERSEELANLV